MAERSVDLDALEARARDPWALRTDWAEMLPQEPFPPHVPSVNVPVADLLALIAMVREGDLRDAATRRRAYHEAANLVEEEARWQTEQQMRGNKEAAYAADRTAMLVRMLRRQSTEPVPDEGEESATAETVEGPGA